MSRIINNNPHTLSEPILRAIEQYWGFSLPSSFRNFLLKNNGGKPEKNIFFFKGKNTGSDIRTFLGICPDSYTNLLKFLKLYNQRIPSNLFPIGYDSFGNLILLSVKNADRGKIYFWDHEREADEGEVPDYSNLTLIADSFEEFINNLHTEEEIDVPGR